jgi:hypothetical protein
MMFKVEEARAGRDMFRKKVRKKKVWKWPEML